VDAERFRDSVAGDLVRGSYIPPDAGRQRFLAFADEWASARDWKPATAVEWCSTRKRIEREPLARTPLAQIDQLALQTFRESLRDRYRRSTVELTMAKVRAVLRAAVVNGRLARNPAEGLAPLKRRAGDADGTVDEHAVPTTDEALALLRAAPVRYRAAIALGLAGLRRGEVLGLALDSIDLDRRLITVRRQLSYVNGHSSLTSTKNETERTIEIAPALAFELRRHVRDHVDRSRTFESVVLLFQGSSGLACTHPPHFYGRAWQPAERDAGLAGRFTFHGLRHYCASTLLAHGADVAMVAGYIGDSVETVSRTYVHWLRDTRHVPAEILGRVLAPEQQFDEHEIAADAR
jgi:integrase